MAPKPAAQLLSGRQPSSLRRRRPAPSRQSYVVYVIGMSSSSAVPYRFHPSWHLIAQVVAGVLRLPQQHALRAAVDIDERPKRLGLGALAQDVFPAQRHPGRIVMRRANNAGESLVRTPSRRASGIALYAQAIDAPMVFPEPLFDPRLIDAAAFLFFDEPLLATLAPAPTLAGGGFEVHDWVLERRPPWASTFLALDELWGRESDGCVETFELLRPLRERLCVTLLAVPADNAALERAGELVAAAGFDRDAMRRLVDPRVAAGELMNHIYLEKWLELEKDASALYAYVDELMSAPERLDALLCHAYMLRIAHLPASYGGPILLNRPPLAPFLLALPGADSEDDPGPNDDRLHDAAAWELFCQLLRPYLEPITSDVVDVLADCVASRQEEVVALKRQTERLAQQIEPGADPDVLAKRVKEFIRLHVADDVAELLRLNQDAKQAFIDSLLTDRGAWVAALAAGHGAMAGSVQWSLGGAIGAIATLGSKGYAGYAERRRKLAASDYRLVYTVAR